MKIRNSILLFLLVSILIASPPDVSKSEHYLFSGMNAGYSLIRDTGTSPLWYRGANANLSLGYADIDPLSSLCLIGNIYAATTFAAQYYNLNYFTGHIGVMYRHTLPFIKQEHLRLRLGGILNGLISGAMNTDFQNATLNMDYLIDLSMSTELEYDFCLPEKHGKFLFIDYALPQRQYAAFFDLDLPLLILNGRPEFAYLNPDDNDYFSRHYYLGGYKMATKLGVKRYLNNGNIIEVSYDWMMYTSGKKDLYLLERASHSLSMAFYFKLN